MRTEGKGEILVTEEEFGKIFRHLSQLKVMADAVAEDETLTKSNIEDAISIYGEEYDYYKHLYSKDHLIRRELIALRRSISKLNDRLIKTVEGKRSLNYTE